MGDDIRRGGQRAEMESQADTGEKTLEGPPAGGQLWVGNRAAGLAKEGQLLCQRSPVRSLESGDGSLEPRPLPRDRN